MNVLSMALEIVVVVEDFVTNFTRIFARRKIGLRTAVDADSMPTQIEPILMGEKHKTGHVEKNKRPIFI